MQKRMSKIDAKKKQGNKIVVYWQQGWFYHMNRMSYALLWCIMHQGRAERRESLPQMDRDLVQDRCFPFNRESAGYFSEDTESKIKKGGLGHPGSYIEEGNHEHYRSH
jgi:hypothetical protein